MRRRLWFSLALGALVYGVACGRAEPTAVAPPRAAVPESPVQPASPAAAPAAAGDANGLPSDVPIPPGLESLSVSSSEPGSIVALFTGDQEPEEVARVFADGLRSSGWSIDETRTSGSDLGLFARKDQRLASVVVTRLSGKLHVELGLWQPKP